MKKNEVPQDNEPDIYQDKFGDGLVKYAVDEDQRFVTVKSSGWEPEIVALQHVWEEVNLNIDDVRRRVKNGELSPIVYYMEKKLMDISILAGYVNLWQWQVKRHCKPSIFAKLKSTTLQKYADVFGITVEELCNIEKL